MAVAMHQSAKVLILVTLEPSLQSSKSMIQIKSGEVIE